MHVKLKWGMNSLKTDRGVLSNEVAALIAKTANELKVQPEDVALAWLECVATHHGLTEFNPADIFAWRVESFAFPRHIADAIERGRKKEKSNNGTPSEYIENCLHEKFLLEDPIYEAAWVKLQKDQLIAKRSKRPSA